MDSFKRSKKRRDPAKSQLIRSIFEIDDKPTDLKKKDKNVIIIKYNETVYFKNQNSKDNHNEDIQKYISNVLKSNQSHSCSKEPNSHGNPNIQFNVNINNNYYNSINNNRDNEGESTIANRVKSTPFNQNSIQRKNSKTSMTSPGPIMRKKSSKEDNGLLLYIPCMNCGNSISADDIERHSMICTKVTDEVLKTESNTYELYSINYKLNKLKEHVQSITSGKVSLPSSIEKEMMYISTVLLQYINDTLIIEIINIKSIQDLKKLLKNLDTLSQTYKSSVSTMILIDRTKILIKEKLKIFVATYRIQINTRKTNEIKKGNIKYEDELNQKKKELEKITQETELTKTKVKNLRKSATPLNKPKNLNIIINNSAFPETQTRPTAGFTTSSNNLNDLSDYMNDDNTSHIDNKLEEIVSDVDNVSQNVSINTSMSNLSSFGREDEGGDIRGTIGTRGSVGSMYKKSLKEINDTDEAKCNNKNEIDLNFYGTFNNNAAENLKNKKLFYNTVLKIKLEKLHNSHKGMQIPPKMIFMESQRLRIPEDRWTEFILGELNNPIKYMNLKKKLQMSSKREPTMSVIAEEK